MALRGIRRSGATVMCGAPHSPARSASGPPWLTATRRAPAWAASVPASRVSSVDPEHDTARTRVRGPTKPGSS